MSTQPSYGGWEVGRFVPVELDVALTLSTGYFALSGLDEEYGDLVRPLAADWKAEAREILGAEPRMVSLIELATMCTETTFEDDYARALMPLRSLDARGVLERLGGLEPGGGALAPDARVPVVNVAVDAAQKLAAALVERQIEAYRRAGLQIDPEGPQIAATRAEAVRLGRILAGGDLHERFWPWLDRFFYEWYQPWRRTREGLMATAEQRATMALGASHSDRGTARLEWLEPQNPLRLLPELRRSIDLHGQRIYFWVEPFGLADVSIVRVDALCVSFGEPGRIYAEFRKHARRVALRAKALGDPTRLTILRLIRHFSAMNTELAEYLDIARPTVSVHAKILREAGLITSRQEGHAVRHEINRTEIRQLFEDLYRFLDLGPFDPSSRASGEKGIPS